MAGKKGKRERPSERKRAANRENAKKPRLAARKPTPAREALIQQALDKLASSLPYVAELNTALARDELYVDREDGTRERVHVPLELRHAAARDINDRAGVPRRTDVQGGVNFGFSIGTGEGGVGVLGWPTLEAGDSPALPPQPVGELPAPVAAPGAVERPDPAPVARPALQAVPGALPEARVVGGRWDPRGLDELLALPDGEDD